MYWIYKLYLDICISRLRSPHCKLKYYVSLRNYEAGIIEKIWSLGFLCKNSNKLVYKYFQFFF